MPITKRFSLMKLAINASVVATILGVGLAGLHAQAQETLAEDVLQEDRDASMPDESTSIETMRVTALKREQTLLEVPAAVTAFTGTQLEERSIENLQDLSFAVPGLVLR